MIPTDLMIVAGIILACIWALCGYAVWLDTRKP